MTMRERLARTAEAATEGELNMSGARLAVDAILRELMEPSEGMLIAGQLVWEKEGCYGGPWGEHHAKVLQAMLQHVIDEPQQEDDAA